MVQSCKVIIQARSGSTRLPRKVLLPFHNKKSILQIELEKILKICPPEQIVVATTTAEADDLIVEVAQKAGVLHFRGDEQNVLQRFIDCAEYFNLTHMIRICSDNVFIDVQRIQQLINLANNDVEYASFLVNGKPAILTHTGIWCELVSTSALKRVNELTSEQLFREHVTNYIYTHADKFKIKWIPVVDEKYRGVRLTIDTRADFEVQQEIFSKLFKKHGLHLNTNDIFEFLNLNPSMLQSMEQQIKENEK